MFNYPIFSIFFNGILPSFGLFLIIYFILRFIILPKLTLTFYAKQGAYQEFTILPRFHEQKFRDLEIHNDSSYEEKRFAKLNPNVRFKVSNRGEKIILTLIDTNLIKSFYNKQDYYKKTILAYGIDELMSNGLLLSEGTTWKRHRRTISSIFHFEFVKSLIPTMTNTTRDFFNRIEKESLDNVDIMTHFQYITGDVVGRSFFGEELSLHSVDGESLTSYMANLVTEIFFTNKTTWRYILGPFFKKLPKMQQLKGKVQKLRGICESIMKERRKSRVDKIKQGIPSNKITQKPDLLDLLLDVQEKDDENKFTDDEIIDEFITFYFAGTDTTGHTVAILTYLLTQYPDVYQRLEEEIRTVYQPNLNSEGFVSMETLNKLEYFQAVFKETLRFITPVDQIFLRKALKDHELEDLKIKKGTLVNLNFTINNYNPKNYEDPEKFDPDRWLNGQAKNPDPYVFIPFSSGPRNCIGQHISQVESKIIISEFLSRFKIELADENFKLKMINRLLYEPLKPVKLTLKKK